jgi:photosystem II stability/assembly factor-like uncharacterized protein
MKKTTLILLTLIGYFAPLLSQDDQPHYTPAGERMQSATQRQALAEKSLVTGIEFRSIGPTVFSGRVADLEVSPEDPSHFYVGYASGGLWKTENNGTSFTPLFENETVMTIGDIAVDWSHNTIWIGSGEVNSSRSSYAGNGVYKSTDGGKTWRHLGLDETHHIGRIILHPSNPDIAWVAALGRLYSANPDRGVFKTTDGGRTWQKTLFVNDNTGAVDLVIDPKNPNILYAAAWERTRRAWNFVESGEGSGIYKSTDGGKTWKLLTDAESGFPTGGGTGRIGLAIGRYDNKTVVYAALDNYNRRPKEEEEEEEALTKDDLREMSKEDFLKLDTKDIQEYLTANRFPRQYEAKNVIQMVKSGEIQPSALVEYTENANSLLFDTDVIGLEIYRSDDQGRTWSKTHEDYLDEVYYSYGYYFGQIRVAPHDPNKIYVLGVPVIRSDDGGQTFRSINGDNVHADHHALWANPDRAGHLILGNDGGVNISYDDGETWIKCNTPAVGQFYYVAVDMAEPYNVYGGLQDNGVWMGPNTYRSGTEWHGSGHYPYIEIYGGDGMQVAVDTRDNETVYTGLQFGNYARLNTRTGEQSRITPRHKLGERPLRWNWQTPIHLSVHNQDILYMGSNKLHRSFNQGNDFDIISDDLTTGGRKGDVPYGTLTAIHESPLKFGLIYAGSDDGLIHVTRDGGNSWRRISDSLPQDLWVSRIQASQYEKGRVYCVLNGYRWDDFTPYLYVSEDYGQNWTAIGKDLPVEPLNVVKEDPHNENILYVGSDHGLYVSLDRGQSFMLMNNGLPAVAVHDVVVHPREKDIIVGTHGRSLYKAGGSELEQLTPELLAQDLKVFDIEPVRHSGNWGRQSAQWREPSEPEISIPIYAKSSGEATLVIKSSEGLELSAFTRDCTQGLNYLPYSLTVDVEKMEAYQQELSDKKKKEEEEIKLEKADDGKLYLQPGVYTIVVKMGEREAEGKLEVRAGRGGGR